MGERSGTRAGLRHLPKAVREIVKEINGFLGDFEMSPSTFGREALNDSTFVHQLRAGERSPSLRTVERIRKFMADHRRERAAEAKRKGAA